MFHAISVSDRSARLKEMQERQEELESNNKRLQQEEQDLRERYHEVSTYFYYMAELVHGEKEYSDWLPERS